MTESMPRTGSITIQLSDQWAAFASLEVWVSSMQSSIDVVNLVLENSAIEDEACAWLMNDLMNVTKALSRLHSRLEVFAP